MEYDFTNLTDEELIARYDKVHRQVSQLNQDQLDGRGYNAQIYPIMNVIPRTFAKGLPPAVETIYCPGKSSRNAFASMPSPREQISASTVQAVAATMGATTAARVAEILAPIHPISPTNSEGY